MKALHMIAFGLTIIGGLNWGIVGLTGFGGTSWNLVTWICSYIGGAPVENVIYVLVGLSAIWLCVDHMKTCRMCSAKM